MALTTTRILGRPTPTGMTTPGALTSEACRCLPRESISEWETAVNMWRHLPRKYLLLGGLAVLCWKGIIPVHRMDSRHTGLSFTWWDVRTGSSSTCSGICSNPLAS